MRISGFTMGKNAQKLYYPIRESIASILPLVDEFVVALGDSDPDDRSEEEILSLNSPKIRIIHTVWDLDKYPRGMENARQTDMAKSHCVGDWLFYLQADEVVHEKYLPVIKKRCEELLDNKKVEGLLFRYRHFWGDYDHYLLSHGWYPDEIRIIRNDPEIHSWESAQSFRRIPGFDGVNYRIREGTSRLYVARVDAEIYHYGWVRPPSLMQQKRKSLDTIHKGESKAAEIYSEEKNYFDYGPMKRTRRFEGAHPAVMKDMISRFNWAHQLNYSGSKFPDRPKYKHEILRYRLLTWMEQNINGGRPIGGFENYRLLDV